MKLDELKWKPYPYAMTNSIWSKVANTPAGTKLYWSEKMRVYTFWLGPPRWAGKHIRYLEPLQAQCVLHLLVTNPAEVHPDITMKNIPDEVT